MLNVYQKIVQIVVLISLLLSFPLIGFYDEAEGQVGTRSDYETPDKLLEWTMDDLAANATSAVNATGNVFRILGNITIAIKDTLVIAPGQILRFLNNTSLLVLGNIKVQGNESSPVVFTSNATSPLPGDWNGILFDGSRTPGHQSISLIDRSIIEYAVNAISGINTSVTISNNLVRSAAGHGMTFSTSASLLSSNHLTDCGSLENSSGIFIEGSNAVLDNNLINNTGRYGIFVETLSSAVVSKNSIRNVTTGTAINNSYGIILENNHYTNVSTGVRAVNGSTANITANTFEFYNGLGILVDSNNVNVTRNYIQFIHTGISITSCNNIYLGSNVIENVTNAISLDDIAESRISQNVINYTTNVGLAIKNGLDINVSHNRVYDHFGDGIFIDDSEDISIFENVAYFGHGVSVKISDCIGTSIIGNRIYFSFNKGLTLRDTTPDPFTSNLIIDSANLDLEIFGDMKVTSLNNTISYSKLYLDKSIKFVAMNYFSVEVFDNNNLPFAGVEIKIIIDNAVSQKHFTDANGMVKNILLTYREYDGPSQYTQDQIFLTAVLDDLEFDYSPFEIDAAKTSSLILHANFIPVIRVHTPPENKTLSGTVFINGTAFDLDSTIKNLWIQVGMTPWEAVTPDNPDWTVWHFVLDTTKYSDGFYQLNFSISDGRSTGRQSYPVIIFNGDIAIKDLSVSIHDPLESEAVWGTITIRGTTTVGDHPIGKVVVQVDERKWSNATPGSVSESRSEIAGGMRSVDVDWSTWSFDLDTRTLKNGEHSVYAFVTDGEEVAADTRTLFVTNVPVNETMKIHADFETPGNSETVSGEVYITGIVWGSNDPILDLKLNIDNRAISDTFNVQGPNWWLWNYTWNTSRESNGLHHIEVWARNKSLSMVDDIVVIVDNVLVNNSNKSEMNIVILSPKESDILTEMVLIQGITWFESEAVTAVQVRIDEGEWQDAKMVEEDWIRWSYMWDTTSGGNGIHFIDAKMDTAVQSIITTVFVIVDNVGLESDLSVVITAPRNGSTVNGTVTVKGVAWYGDHPIISVDVQFGPYLWKTGEPLREDWSGWFYEWDTTKLEDGEYNLKCRVYDGFETVKYSIIVRINNEKGDTPGNGVDPPDPDSPDGTGGAVSISNDYGSLSILIGVNIIITVLLLFFIIKERKRKGVDVGSETGGPAEEKLVENGDNDRSDGNFDPSETDDEEME